MRLHYYCNISAEGNLLFVNLIKLIPVKLSYSLSTWYLQRHICHQVRGNCSCYSKFNQISTFQLVFTYVQSKSPSPLLV